MRVAKRNQPKKENKQPVATKLIPRLAVGQWPQGDDEWKEAIAVISNRVADIMAVCNKQAGPDAYCDCMPYDQAVLFWYGHIADHLIQQKKQKQKRLEAAPDFIDV